VNAICLTAALVGERDQKDEYLRVCGAGVRTIYIRKASVCQTAPIANLGNLCPNVTSISCPPGLKLPDYAAIAQAWPRLTKITMTRGICGEGLLLIAHGCRELAHVSIDTNSILVNDKVQFIAALPDTVQTLNLGRTHRRDEGAGSGVTASVRLLSALAAARLPALSVFSDDDSGVTLSDDLLLTLAQRCSLAALHLRRYDLVTQDVLLALPRYCRLRELSISEELGLSNECIAVLLEGFAPTLTKLKFEGAQSTSHVLRTLAASCAHLQELEVNVTTKVTVTGWAVLARGCPQLSELDVYSARMTDSGLLALAEGCVHLRSLMIQEEEGYLTDSGLQAVGRSCKQLRSLLLLGCEKVTDAGLCAVAAGCPRLRDVKVDVSCSDRFAIALAENCRDLRALSLNSLEDSEHSLTDDGVTALVLGCRKLRELNFDSAPLLTEAVLSAIAAHCSVLRSLYLRQCEAFHSAHTHIYKELFSHDVSFAIT
jgi:hypothetical protein